MCIRWLTRPSSITLFPYTTLSDLLERLPLDEVHRVVVQALGLADLVHGHHVRMPDLGQRLGLAAQAVDRAVVVRSEEHTSELQSLRHLVCRLLLEKKKLLNCEESL